MAKKITKKRRIIYEDIANYFLALGSDKGDGITNLRLQKLVYYAQGWYLANYSKPLFDADFQAWVHGPAIPDLYRKYKRYGSSPIDTKLKFEELIKKFQPKTIKFLEEVAKVYMLYNAFQLERMVHNEEPWLKARKGYIPEERCNAIISKESMKKYYGARIKDKANSNRK